MQSCKSKGLNWPSFRFSGSLLWLQHRIPAIARFGGNTVTKQISSLQELTFWLGSKGQLYKMWLACFTCLDATQFIVKEGFCLSLFVGCYHFKSVSVKMQNICFLCLIVFILENFTASLDTMLATSNMTYANNSPLLHDCWCRVLGWLVL